MKELLLKIIAFIQNLITKLPVEKDPETIDPVSGKPKWIVIAEKEVGVKERTGGENKRILEYHDATSLNASEDEIAWCSSFVNWVMRECGMERTNSAQARSWLQFKNDKKFKKHAIVIFKRGNSKWQGHVGFALEDKGDAIRVLGGNQGNSVSISSYKKSDVLGYVWPKKDV